MRREKIVKTIISHLKSIKKERQGWEPKIFEWLATPLGPDDYPAIIVKDTEDNVDSESVAYVSKHELTIEILLFTQGEESAASLRKMLQDILRLFRDEQIGLDEDEDLGDHIFIVSNEIMIEQQQHIHGGARLELKVLYNTEKWSL